jgi:WD40 repeat protein
MQRILLFRQHCLGHPSPFPGKLVPHVLALHAFIIGNPLLKLRVVVCAGSEDNTMRIWRATGECLQVIEHPGCLWDITFLPNADLVSACSDAVARVWSTQEGRQVSSHMGKAGHMTPCWAQALGVGCWRASARSRQRINSSTSFQRTSVTLVVKLLGGLSPARSGMSLEVLMVLA